MSKTPKMTKVHFEAIAAVMLASKPRRGHEFFSQWTDTLSKFVEMCRASNPRFDEVKFLEACGYGWSE